MARPSRAATRPAALGMLLQSASAEAPPERLEAEHADGEMPILLLEPLALPEPLTAEAGAPDEPLPAFLPDEDLVASEARADARTADLLSRVPTLADATRRLRPRRFEPTPAAPVPAPVVLRPAAAVAPASRPAVAAAAIVAARADPGNTPPPYPARLVPRGWRGTVVLRIQVDAQGAAAEVRVAAGSGYESVDELALDAARRWRFAPAYSDGRPIASVIVQRIRFEP